MLNINQKLKTLHASYIFITVRQLDRRAAVVELDCHARGQKNLLIQIVGCVGMVCLEQERFT